MKLVSFLLCSCYFILPFSSSTNRHLPTESLEQRLQDHLFQDYNPLVRPRVDSGPVVVSIEVVITAIVDVKDKEGIITVAGWIDLEWKDFFLCWDPADYGNISHIVVPAEKVWLPAMVDENRIEGRFIEFRNVPIGISSNCSISVAPGGISSYSCEWDTTLFPFDTQRCAFEIFPYDTIDAVFLMNHTLKYEDGSNAVWDVVGTRSTLQWEHKAYAIVRFTLMIKRKFLYYVTYIFLPLIMMAIVNLLVFWLHSASGEKLSLAITVLLAFYVLLITINEQLPVSSTSTPLLTIYTSCLMSICTLSMVVTVLVVHLYHHENVPVPPWVIKLLRLRGKNSENKSVNARDQEGPLRDPQPTASPSWKDVSVAVDRLAFFVFLTLECLITMAIAICYAVGIHDATLHSE